MQYELTLLREKFGRFLIGLLWLHAPLLAVVAALNGHSWLWAGLSGVAIAGVYHLSYARNGIALSTRYISSVALMAEPALLVFLLRGHAWQMDMHMYFFAMLALTIAWFDARPILMAAVAVALHHLVLVYLLPYAVFPANADLPRVLLHAAIVAFQTVVLVWLARMISAAFERIRDMNQEILTANAELKQRTTEAEKANQAKSMFVANMSHEIRTPLNAVLGFCHLMQRTEMNARQLDYVQKISDAGTTLLRLINDILDFSKNEAGKLTLEAAPFNPHAVIEQQLQMVLVDAERKGVRLEVQKDPGIPREVMGDGMRFGQVILNLVSNAVKFTEQGSVTVRTRAEAPVGNGGDDQVTMLVEIIDTGIGMSPEQQKNLFTSFTQADNTMTRRFGGTGLGLAISRQIVGLMGGDITVRSRQWEGTTFSFTVHFNRVSGSAPQDVVPDPGLRDLRILGVDDNPASRQLIEELFHQWGMRADVTVSASEAISRLQAADGAGKPYELVLIDWKMPGMDGLEAVRAISQDAYIRAKPKMVVVTAYGSDQFTSEIDGYGHAGYLTKPLQPRAVITTLEDLFRNRLAGSAQDHAEKAKPRIDGVPQVEPALRGQRVLLVEDNEINREIAIELLTDAGLLVDAVENGLQAVEQVARQGDSYAMVLMDLQMPIMDGIEATIRIRKDRSAAELPIVAMTAHAYADEKDRCMAAGMNDHVAKPVEPPVLLAALNRWLKPVTLVPAPVSVAKVAPAGDDLPDHLPPFGIARALERVNGKRPLLRRLILSFADSQARVPDELGRLLAEGKYDDARRTAHTLKGLAGSLELPDLQQAAAEMERALKEGTPGEHEAAPYIARIAAWLEPAVAAARGLSGTTVAAGDRSAPVAPASATEIEARRAALHEQLIKRSLSARAGFAAWAGALGLPAEAIAAHPLRLALDRLDYATALRELEMSGQDAGPGSEKASAGEQS